MKIDLRVRKIEPNGSFEDGVVEVGSEDEAVRWLTLRPHCVEVLGVATYGVDRATVERLRAATRPLDADERIAQRAVENVIERAAILRDAEARATQLAAVDAHREAMKTADPDRIMEIHWTYDHGLRLLDEADPRPIPEAAREAVRAWIDERNAWVKDRGQIVGEATLKVWPGPVPAGSERVAEGRFFPVTAPETLH
jgi:hypothetical protein